MASSTYQVIGMTCGHCVAAVSSELETLDGVSEVAVELDPTGTLCRHRDQRAAATARAG